MTRCGIILYRMLRFERVLNFKKLLTMCCLFKRKCLYSDLICKTEWQVDTD